MIRKINTEQILTKTSRFLDSTFGTPAFDHIIFVEVGSIIQFNEYHLPKAIHMTVEQIPHQAHRYIKNTATEIILYGNKSNDILVNKAADLFEKLNFYNLYIYSEGKETWLNQGLGIETSLVPIDQSSVNQLLKLPIKPQKSVEPPFTQAA